jgi:predicted RNA-binding Zn-ribbon protein involved in translation (DUF1610 family)
MFKLRRPERGVVGPPFKCPGCGAPIEMSTFTNRQTGETWTWLDCSPCGTWLDHAELGAHTSLRPDRAYYEAIERRLRLKCPVWMEARQRDPTRLP